jgi:hypothetical protein
MKPEGIMNRISNTDSSSQLSRCCRVRWYLGARITG